jgi:uncharacterized protein (TIGR02284 family)
MAIATTGIEEMVRDLIQICRQGEQGFAAAANAIIGRELKQEFRTYSIERAGFAEALMDALDDLGYEPSAPNAPAEEALSWTSLIELNADNEHAVMVACEHGENAAREAYVELIRADAPQRIADLMSDQFPIIEATRERIRELRETAEYY